MSQLHNEEATLDEKLHSASPDHGYNGVTGSRQGTKEDHQYAAVHTLNGSQSILDSKSSNSINIEKPTPSSAPTTNSIRQNRPDDPSTSTIPASIHPAVEPSPDSQTSNHTYPEGGLRAWLVVLGSFSGMTACFGLMNTSGAFQAYLSTHQLSHLPPSTIGWIFSVYTFVAFFCGVQIGPIFDAKGPRWLVVAGTVCLVGGVFGVAESTGMPAPDQCPFRLGLGPNHHFVQNYGTFCFRLAGPIPVSAPMVATIKL